MGWSGLWLAGRDGEDARLGLCKVIVFSFTRVGVAVHLRAHARTHEITSRRKTLPNSAGCVREAPLLLAPSPQSQRFPRAWLVSARAAYHYLAIRVVVVAAAVRLQLPQQPRCLPRFATESPTTRQSSSALVLVRLAQQGGVASLVGLPRQLARRLCPQDSGRRWGPQTGGTQAWCSRPRHPSAPTRPTNEK